MQNVVWSQGGLAWVLSPTIGRNEEAPLADEYHEAFVSIVSQVCHAPGTTVCEADGTYTSRPW